MKPQATKAERRAGMASAVTGWRDLADETAAKFGCDDPLHPWTVGEAKPYQSWREFAERVCLPIALSDDDGTVQEAMAWFRKECPHYLAAALVFAENALRLAEGRPRLGETPEVRRGTEA